MNVPSPSVERYALLFFRNALVVAVGGCVVLLFLFVQSGKERLAGVPIGWAIAGGALGLVVSALLAYRQVLDEQELYWETQKHLAAMRRQEEKRELQLLRNRWALEQDEAEVETAIRLRQAAAEVLAATNDVKAAEAAKDAAQARERLYRATLMERSSGFPSMVAMLEQLDEKEDAALARRMKRKKHPALKSAETVRVEAQRRRDAERHLRMARSIVEYYEVVAPFLTDLRGEEFGDGSDDAEPDLSPFTTKEREDPLTEYLTKDEYRSLSSVEKGQLGLDRFWQRHKSKRLIGKLYERYVGYLYEEMGYEVEYVGIFKGYEDLGRDLICTKGDQIVIVQCKNWSQFKTIYEKHIFQFFGTVFEYRDKHRDREVRASFYTTTTLSNLARKFASELQIDLVENHHFDTTYPCIKCNVSRGSKEKIYHLPFDQQYDKTKIEPSRDEFYCRTVAEAEEAGFRRAFRYQGLRGSKG